MVRTAVPSTFEAYEDAAELLTFLPLRLNHPVNLALRPLSTELILTSWYWEVSCQVPAFLQIRSLPDTTHESESDEERQKYSLVLGALGKVYLERILAPDIYNITKILFFDF